MDDLFGYPSAEHPPSTEIVRETYSYTATAVEGITERREQAFDRWLAEVKAEATTTERERIYSDVLMIPAWGSRVDEDAPGGFDVPGTNARALVLNTIRTSASSSTETEGH